jgi:hypothetical protein
LLAPLTPNDGSDAPAIRRIISAASSTKTRLPELCAAPIGQTPLVFQLLRLYADEEGAARFAYQEIAFDPVEPAVHELSVATPWATNGAVVVQAPRGGSHPQQPEARRNLVVVVSGEVEVTASGETYIGRPGDVLLIEDTTGTGHSSRTPTGFTALMVFLD